MAGPAILTLPASVVLALWLPTVADGASARRAARAVVGDDVPHLVRAGIVGTPIPLPGLLGELGAPTEVAAVLPRAGDPMGLPAGRSAEALEAGEGVLVRRRGETGAEVCTLLVPVREEYGSAVERGEMVTWTVTADLAAHVPAPSLLLAALPPLSQARRDIQLALSDAVETLEDLDVARDRPDLAEDLLDLSLATVPDRLLPPGLEPARVDVLERAARLLAIVALATDDDGGAVSAGQAALRGAALAHVERAARRALCAASATRAAG